jgi:hypothetical protein
MRREPEQRAFPEAGALDADADVSVDLGMERPRRVTPALAKSISYKRDRRFVAEYPHLERRSRPKRKVLRNQTWRRRVDATLRPALGEVTPETEDFTPEFPRRQKSRRGWRHANIPLGQWVNDKLENRLSFVGRNIGTKIYREPYRLRLIPFLESVAAGCGGHSVELAVRFQPLLDDLAEPDRLQRRDRRQLQVVSWVDGWCRALRELFAEQPEWETKLRAWIAQTSPSAPPADEPAWKRIRRLRNRSTPTARRKP